MSIIKVVNGEKKVIANVSITDHSQLTGNNAYGAHPISAIRKLPEKLYDLKEKDIELESRITAHDAEVDAQILDVTTRIDSKIDEVNTLIENNQTILNGVVSNLQTELIQRTNDIGINAQRISLVEDPVNLGKLIFTDFSGGQTSVQGGFLPDNDNLILTPDFKLTLNRVYTNNTLTGTGRQYEPLIVKGISDDTGTNSLDFNYFINLSNSIDGAHIRINEVNTLNELQNHKIKSIEDITKGMGGYLNSYDFGANPTQEALTAFAIQDTGAANQFELFTGTKVINLHDDHIWILTNTPDSMPPVFSWQDLGVQPNISVATDKYFGLVKSSYEDLQGSIDLNGYITINNLETRLSSINDNYNTLNNRVTDLNTTFTADINSLTESLAVTRAAVQSNSFDIGNLKSKDDALDLKINQHTSTISAIQNSLTNLNTTINNLNDTYATDAELANLATQLTLATKIVRLNEG